MPTNEDVAKTLMKSRIHIPTYSTPWQHRGGFVANSDGKMVLATSSAAAAMHEREWAQYPATIASNDIAKAASALPELIQAAMDALESLRRLPNAEGAYRVTCVQQLETALEKAGF